MQESETVAKLSGTKLRDITCTMTIVENDSDRHVAHHDGDNNDTNEENNNK